MGSGGGKPVMRPPASSLLPRIQEKKNAAKTLTSKNGSWFCLNVLGSNGEVFFRRWRCCGRDGPGVVGPATTIGVGMHATIFHQTYDRGRIVWGHYHKIQIKGARHRSLATSLCDPQHQERRGDGIEEKTGAYGSTSGRESIRR